MPIRVNLKELFPSDSQEITIDKVNFNFNKLLELGVGDPGIQGLSGIQGPAGPTGLVGPAGLRGSTWFVDSGDPNTLTGFVDLLDNDLYLDSVLFNVWQYDIATDTWTLVASISTIVNNYLAASVSPFRRGLGLSSPEDDRFITFNRRGDTYLDTQLDINLGTLNPANNDTLFLNNFNEDVLNSALANFSFTATPGELFNSLLSIHANHSEGASALQGRYHLEMGSLYENTQISPSQVEMSELRHNLKAKFLKEDVSLTTPLTNTNYWLNIARFSLGKLENSSITTIDQNGRFEFVVPKYNDEGISTIQGEVTISLGAAESLIEQSAVPVIVPDGISISSSVNGVIFGIKEGLENELILPYSAGNADFALFDVSSGLNGFFFNDNIVQSSGNITQLITNDLTAIDDDLAYSGTVTSHYMNQGIFVGSNTLWITSGSGSTLAASSIGAIAKYDITNPTQPERIFFNTGNRNLAGLGSVDAVDQHGHNYRNDLAAEYTKPLGLIKDAAEYGKYLVTVSNRSSSGIDNDLAIYETDSQFNRLTIISRIEEPELEAAYRVHVNGRYAWVITNSTTITGPQVPGSPTQARLTAVDLINPALPVVIDSYQDPQPGSKYLDFKIYDNKAIVLRYTNYYDSVTPANSSHQLDLLVFDIFDPTSFSTTTIEIISGFPPAVTTLPYCPQDTQLLDSFTVNTTRTEYGALHVQGRDVSIVWEGQLYIVELNSTTGTGAAGTILKSTTSLAAEPVYANDVVSRGRYSYVLVNYADSTGAIQAYDLTDKTAPLLVSETRNASLRNSSRFVIQGKYMYLVSTQAGTSTRLITVDLNGIESPGANIGSIRTTDLQVMGNTHIKNNLHVKNSLNVGPGGIFVDEGVGIIADSPIVTSNLLGFSTDFKKLNTNDSANGFTVNLPSDSSVFDFNGLQINAIAFPGDQTTINGDYTGISILAEANQPGLAGSNFNVNGNLIGSSLVLIGGSLSPLDITGDLIGSNFEIGRFIDVGGSVYGSKITIGQIPSGDVVGDVYGYHVLSNADMDTNKNFYGVYVDATGTVISGTGEKYGIYSEDTSKNRLDGELVINDHPHLVYTNVTDPTQTSSNNQFVSGRYDIPGTVYAFTRVGDIVTCTGRTDNDTVNIPLGTAINSNLWGVASISGGVGGTPGRVEWKNASQAIIKEINGGVATGNIWFTFSYWIS